MTTLEQVIILTVIVIIVILIKLSTMIYVPNSINHSAYVTF